MNTHVPNVHYRRRHWRGYHRMKQILLWVGLVGLVIGLGLCCGYGWHQNGKLVRLGLAYVLLFSAIVGIRGIMEYLGQVRKNKHEREAQSSPSS